jgi:DNA-binding NarL/FixJ family response regulator
MAYNILIVDDSKLARMAVAKALRAQYADCARLEAANADEAIALTHQHRIDVALLDFNMPGRDGLALAAELRERYPDLPIGLVSANHQTEIVDRARSVGAIFLSKPVTEVTLNDFMAEAIARMAAADR